MEEFLRDIFKEQLLYVIFRNSPTLASGHNRELLRSRFPRLDISKIYRKIISHQVKTFGITLTSNKKKGLIV